MLEPKKAQKGSFATVPHDPPKSPTHGAAPIILPTLLVWRMWRGMHKMISFGNSSSVENVERNAELQQFKWQRIICTPFESGGQLEL
jgi:heme/copper-type cytochrome/quinol oxidase subunit 2